MDSAARRAALRRPSLVRTVLGVALLAVAVPALPADTPDFSGVYRSYRDPNPQPTAPLPLKPEVKARAEHITALLEPTGETSGGWCLGSGMPGSMLGSGAYPMEIIQRPEQVTFIYEAHGEIRRVYIGEDNQLPESHRFADRNGYSEGRWEGDTLVVETSHLKEQLDGRYPHSEQASIVERYHSEELNGQTLMVADTVITDPLFYTEPYQIQKKWLRDAGGKMLPYECTETQWLERLDELLGENQG